jgi:hypothetical protein
LLPGVQLSVSPPHPVATSESAKNIGAMRIGARIRDFDAPIDHER